MASHLVSSRMHEDILLPSHVTRPSSLTMPLPWLVAGPRALAKAVRSGESRYVSCPINACALFAHISGEIRMKRRDDLD